MAQAFALHRHAPVAWAFLLLCLLASTLQQAQAGPPSLREYYPDVWTTADGLPHNYVRDIVQTPEGYLWLATWEGLVRYNGVQFRNFNRATLAGLRDNGISALANGRDGSLWIGDTRGNIGHRRGEDDWRFWGHEHGLPRTSIHEMLEDWRGRVWVVFESRGLGVLDPEEGVFRMVGLPGGGDPVEVVQMAEDDAGRLWAGSEQGLLLIDADDRIVAAPEGFRLAQERPAWPYRAPDGGVWVVAGGDVYRMGDDGIEPEPMMSTGSYGRITIILQDSHGVFWLGTENRGVLRIGPDGTESIGSAHGLPPGRVAALFEDRERSIWIGMNGGLFRLREALFSSHTSLHGLSSDYVRALLETRNGDLWIGSSGGLDRMPAGSNGIGNVPLPLPHNGSPSVLSLADNAEGELWVGTFSSGVFQLRDGRVVRRYTDADGLPSNHVRALSWDEDKGVLWVGTRHGVAWIDTRGVHVLDAPGVPQVTVSALLAADGALWIGSMEGLTRWRDGRAEPQDIGEVGDARTVFGFFRDEGSGTIWLGTDRGLFRFLRGQLVHVGMERWVPLDAMFQMVVDRIGYAWISTNRGVLRLRHDDLMQLADGLPVQPLVDWYGEADGMASAQGNGSSGPVIVRRGDGTIWVATALGVASVDPQRVGRFREQLQPTTLIEGVLVDGRPLPWRRDGRITPDVRRIGIDYAGLGFLMPHRIRYRTRLDGFDDDWVPRGNQHAVEYTGLPPGDYVFRVSAATPVGEWGQEAQWHFKVEPKLWQRWDVRVLALIALLLAIFGAYRYRVYRYRVDAERLLRLVESRTRALRSRTERLQQADREKSTLLDRLREQSEAYERLAHEDSLTGLSNRRRFDTLLGEAVARCGGEERPLGLAMLDIDHFKRINDTWTHAAGDVALQSMARMLVAACRGSDTVARMGGEEFALLLPDAGPQEALAICERLRASVEAQAHDDISPELRITVSIGLTAMRPGDTPSEMLRRADKALYAAKAAGRNRVEVEK